MQFENHVFVGDLVANGNHSWIELGQLEEWQKRLGEIQKLSPEYVHPGRGPAGGAELLAREGAYLKNVLRIVRNAHPHGEPSDETLEALQRKIEDAYPGYGYTHFLEIGLPEVWKTEAGRGKKR